MMPPAPAARPAPGAGSSESLRAGPVHLEEGLRAGCGDLLERLRARTSCSPITVPRLAAGPGRRRPRRRGATACTPVGEMITGIDIGWPITDVASWRSAWRPGRPRGAPSRSGRTPVMLVVVGHALLGPGEEGLVHRLLQALLGPPLRLGDRLEPRVLAPRDSRSLSPTSVPRAPGVDGHGQTGHVAGVIGGQETAPLVMSLGCMISTGKGELTRMPPSLGCAASQSPTLGHRRRRCPSACPRRPGGSC